MRMLLKATIPTELGNRAIKDGSFAKAMDAVMTKLKPEAAYFVAEKGRRCAMIFFDMQDSSEPLFAQLHAEIELLPDMNAADLQKGLGATG